MKTQLWAVMTAFLPVVLACKTTARDSQLSDAAAPAADPCPERQMRFEGPVIVLTFPQDCILRQITPKVEAAFSELNSTNPHFLSPFEFRAYDANMAMQSDTLVLDPGTNVEANQIKLRFKDVVGYRIKVDAKDPRHGQAWIGAVASIGLSIVDWNFKQEVHGVHIDRSFGAGNDEDRKRINTLLTFAKVLSDFVERFTRGMTFGIAAVDPLEMVFAKAQKTIAFELLQSTKDMPSLKEQVPPPFTSIADSHTANGQIENNSLVVRLTPRQPVATKAAHP